MYKVLVISSDSALLSNAKRFITNVNSSISVETLEDTSEIKDRLNTANYIDVVICDHNPPAIDAISVFNDLTRMNDLRPFIIMTNKADGNVAIRAFELRMDYYLSRENVTNFYMDLSSKIVLCAERRRLELDRILNEKRMKALMNLVMMREKEFREILNYALEESVTLTNSTMGYIATYDDDSKNLKMEAWSRGGLDRCQMKTHPIIYDFNSTGIWGEPIRQGKPIIVNDYPNEASEYKKGVPHGHVPLNRLMMIPIYHNGKAIATAGVGNKTQEYTSDDLMQFTLLMDGLMSIYHERMLERENIKSERNLKEILQNAPVGVILVDNDLTIEVDNDYARSLLSTHSLCLSKDPLKANSNELSRLISNDIEKARESRYGLEFEHTIESGNQIFVFKVNVAKTKGTNNEDTGFTIIIDDISELALASRQHITAVERINLLDSLINDDIRELLAKIEKEIDNIGESDSADKIKGSVEALKGIMAFVKEYHDVGILEPQWQYLDDVLDYAVKVIKMDGRSVKYNVKGIRVFADPAFYNVFSQFMEYSRTNCRNTPECSIKCRLDDGDLIIRYSDNSAGIPYKKKQDFVSGRMIEYGRGAYLAFNILKACGFGVSESGIPDEEMVIEITIPQPKYSISWE